MFQRLNVFEDEYLVFENAYFSVATKISVRYIESICVVCAGLW